MTHKVFPSQDAGVPSWDVVAVWFFPPVWMSTREDVCESAWDLLHSGLISWLLHLVSVLSVCAAELTGNVLLTDEKGGILRGFFTQWFSPLLFFAFFFTFVVVFFICSSMCRASTCRHVKLKTCEPQTLSDCLLSSRFTLTSECDTAGRQYWLAGVSLLERWRLNVVGSGGKCTFQCIEHRGHFVSSQCYWCWELQEVTEQFIKRKFLFTIFIYNLTTNTFLLDVSSRQSILKALPLAWWNDDKPVFWKLNYFLLDLSFGELTLSLHSWVKRNKKSANVRYFHAAVRLPVRLEIFF